MGISKLFGVREGVCTAPVRRRLRPLGRISVHAAVAPASGIDSRSGSPGAPGAMPMYASHTDATPGLCAASETTWNTTRAQREFEIPAPHTGAGFSRLRAASFGVGSPIRSRPRSSGVHDDRHARDNRSLTQVTTPSKDPFRRRLYFHSCFYSFHGGEEV
jgi:hypothetical protein